VLLVRRLAGGTDSGRCEQFDWYGAGADKILPDAMAVVHDKLLSVDNFQSVELIFQ
jgi:hypothetical protein